MSYYTVWVDIGAGTTVGGNFGGWRQIVDAQVVESSATLGNAGTASIIVHSSNLSYKATATTTASIDVQGRRIGVVSSSSPEMALIQKNTDVFLFVGTVIKQSYDDKDSQYTLACTEIGAEWSEVPLLGWRQQSNTDIYPDGVENEGLRLANIRTPDGRVIGNMTTAGDVRLFDISNSSAASMWTKKALLDHALAYTLPDYLEIEVFSTTEAKTKLVVDSGESYAIDRISFTGLLNMICGGSSGLVWRADYFGTTSAGVQKWFLEISTNDTDAPSSSLDTASDSVVSFRQTLEPIYDEITVEGGPVIQCNTVDFGGGLIKGWSSEAEMAFNADPDIEDALITRQEPQCANVYSYYELSLDATTAGMPDWLGDDFCKALEYDTGTGITSVTGNGITPDMKSLKIKRWIPWTAKNSITEATLSQAQQNNPEKLPILVFDSARLVSNPTDDSWPTPSIAPSNGSPGLHIKFTPPEVSAKGVITGPSNYDPDNALSVGAHDYNDYRVTLAIESGQRVRVTIDNPATDPATEARSVRRLRINAPELQCHVVRKRALLGWEGESPIYPNGSDDYFDRDDFPTAHSIAQQASVWAFASRGSCSVEYAGYNDFANYSIGTRITVGSTDLGIVSTVGIRYGANASITFVSMPSAYATAVRSGGLRSGAVVASSNVDALPNAPIVRGVPPQLPGFAKANASNKVLTFEFGAGNQIVLDAADFVNENDVAIENKVIRLRPVKACNSSNEAVWSLALTLAEADTWPT